MALRRTGPPARRAPLARTGGPTRTRPPRPVSARRQARDKDYPDAREEVYHRARGRCEAKVSPDCTRRCEQVHHLAGRQGPDPHRLTNLLGVCLHCHDWIETNRTESYRLGLLVSRHRSR